MLIRKKSQVRVTVLYEDRRGPARAFGLHRLVERCVHDRLDGEYHLLQLEAHRSPSQ